MEPLIMPFFIQIDPCPLTSFIAVTPVDIIDYMLTTGQKRTISYRFEQQAKCGYKMGVKIVPGLPTFVTVDTQTS